MTKSQDDLLAKLEAILYGYGRPINLTTLCAHLRLEDEIQVSNLINKLSESYQQDESALEIKRLPDRRVVLQLKPEFSKVARRFSAKPLLTEGPLRTLSYVAYNQPIEQKLVIEARGNHVYKHLKSLDEMGLIKREKKGRATIIHTTQDFADYVGLIGERSTMRRQLRRIFRRIELNQMEKK